jgi:hypothetical protein
MRRLPVLAAALLLAALATPLAAYTIYLKDGTHVVAREKYRVENGRAIITLQNGTQTFIAAAEIDVARTENANQRNYGTAVVLEDGKVSTSPKPAPPPPAKPTLADLIASRAATPRERPEARRPGPESKEPTKTPAGNVDLRELPRGPFAQLEVAAEIQQLYRSQGIQEEVAIFRGTQADRPLIEITTNSEASIFRALEASAQVLSQVRQRQPRRVAALEILMMTAARERAGQFLLTPELADELAGQRADTAAFFVKHVQF